jgi:hypothetical protein
LYDRLECLVGDVFGTDEHEHQHHIADLAGLWIPANPLGFGQYEGDGFAKMRDRSSDASRQLRSCQACLREE